ncbi:heptaprenylglyceryl phosphate synthase [Lentibacillus cibarius]|uniref:Heptaprenylglyceryl phosphate synthase n=1 Tax=Lentibacillus cibarius TaxID=2583219 RepID=A0A549YI71_9BACI|nr:heptaprenylglyceryl phosphate synthase [Lentibacillus cibarius]TRM11576.1 heptaprenylglyceryl phosphate synthase [Lentibacillus cibarius]
MNYSISEWKHLFKLDPAKEISDDDINAICESGTDAVIVGGTDGVTLDGVLDLLARIRRHTVPCVLEIANMESITPGFDYYFIPMVMNTTDKKWMMDLQHQAIKEYKELINWNEMFIEGYCILNEDAKAFQKAKCAMPDAEDVAAYAHMAEHVFRLPIFYMEYSGTYGDPELVKSVKNELHHTKLFYGGGIENNFQAREMKEHADAIIVGNLIYDNIKQALKTVKAVNERTK